MLANFFSRRPVFSLSLFQFNALVALWLASVINIPFYQALYSYSSHSGFKGASFVLATVMVVFLTYFCVMQILSWKFTTKFVATLLVMIGGFSSYFVANLGINIDSGQITNLMQTDFHEALDLMSSRWLLWVFGTIIIPLIIIWKIEIIYQPLLKQFIGKLLSVFLALATVLGLLFISYDQYAPIFREHRELKGKLSPLNSISGLSSYVKRQLKTKPKALVHYGTDASLQANPANPPKIMVLVVGETARAENFSLNGYGKNTNPRLAQQDIINFNNVSSCGTATAVSLPCMFSGMQRTQYDPDLAEHREGLLDIAQRAGYQVTWIDNNSGCKGVCTRVDNYVIPESLKQKWCKSDGCYDDILLDATALYLGQLKQSGNQRNQLIVLHQAGSHGPAYYKRYPDEFRHFKPTCDTNAIQTCDQQTLINTYDNTLVYTDYILASLIDQLKQVSGFQTAMWYVSDHGESTGERGLYLHGTPYVMAPRQQTHIPLILWLSESWKQYYPALDSCLNKQVSLAHSHDNMFSTVLSLLDIHTSTIDPRLDFSNNCQN